MKFLPMQDYILVRPEERLKSAVLQVVMSEKPNTGEVVAVGPGKVDDKGRLHPMDVKVGDRIRFGTDAGYLNYPEYWENWQRYLILQEADVCWVEESR